MKKGLKAQKPRRWVRMFQPRFAPLVENGVKSRTIRPIPKRRWPAAGDSISLRAWLDKPYRSKQRVLRESTITAVNAVEICGDSIQLDGRRLTAPEREEFAKADGFESFEDMVGWFRKTHDLPFEGILIRWE